jgi:protein O-mannosyl-transferase
MTSRRITYYSAIAVSLITFALYLADLRNDFIGWDDGTYIIENTHLRSLNGALLKWAFFDFYASNWHPLTWISHALDYAVWGLNPLGASSDEQHPSCGQYLSGGSFGDQVD